MGEAAYIDSTQPPSLTLDNDGTATVASGNGAGVAVAAWNYGGTGIPSLDVYANVFR